MRITDLLDPRSIRLNGTARDKSDAITQMVDLISASGKITNRTQYTDGVYEREKEGSTAVGDGIAIPHCKSDAVTAPALAAMTVPAGVDYEALDGEKVNLIFLIAAPNSKENIHVDVLSKLSTLLLDERFAHNLLAAKNTNEFLAVIDAAETEKDTETVHTSPLTSNVTILAVTACPTGIAHTYMAAESLEKAARKKGYGIKVETRGASGGKNILTAADIDHADGIIVAADTKVPMERFNGKKVIECKVSDGISKASELIDKLVSGSVAVYHTEAAAPDDGTSYGKESAGHRIYKHLMNGVSYMLPFVVGGGILIAIAFLIDGLSINMQTLPIDQRSHFGSITPLAALFMKIGGGAFSFMLPVLAGFIALSIADRPGLAVGFVGGFIASQGKSGFIGALIAGFAAGYLVLLLKKVFSRLPKTLEGIKPILLYPLIGIFITGVFMKFIVEPPIGALNTLMNNTLAGMSGTSGIILGLILGGMMSVDMGGPVNKAAYVFGTASIAAGNFNIMAAVMIGGMVPPIAIAISTLMFKSKYTVEERKAGPANFVMGLSFITEGAIPFAASDPLHVLPSCIIGSAVAGAVSMAADCTLMAPHGGVFVFPVVGHPVMYIVALLIGSFTAAVLLGITKKKVSE
jgi:fructose PTS system EIIBC or EIIC component